MNFLYKMKRILNIIGVFFLCAMFGACQGAEGELELTLKADKTSILADGSDAVTFSVMLGSEDVTSGAEITCINDGKLLESNVFSTTVAGNLSFKAVYGEYESQPQTVVAEAVPMTEPSKYKRNVFVMEFTGQWCSNCPTGWRTLYFYLQKPKYKDNVYVMALHDDVSGEDLFGFPGQLEIHREYDMPGLPCVLVDMRDKAALNTDGGNVPLYFDKSISEGPHCGVAVSSVYDKAAKKAEITVKVAAEKSGKYRLAVWVVEDGLVSWQKDGQVTHDVYTHDHVARKLVSDSYKGDSLGDISRDAEAEKTYEIQADDAWKLENLSVYAVVIDDKGIVNNMAVCAFVDGHTDYALADKE